MTRTILCLALAGTLLLPAGRADEKPARASATKRARPLLTARLELKNGSSLQGRLDADDSITLNTGYGKLTIPLRETYSIRWAMSAREERNQVHTQNGTFSGYIERREPLRIDTGYGVLQVPPRAIRSLHVWRASDADSFDAGLGRWQIKRGTWRIVNGELVGSSTGANYSNQLWLRQRMPESYEVEVTLQGGHQIGLVWNARTTLDTAAIWISGSRVYAYDGPYWYNRVIQTFPGSLPGGKYRLRLKVRGRQTTVSLDGKVLGTVTTRHSGGHFGLMVYSGVARFDDLVVRR